MSSTLILKLHLVATLYMTGVIWFVQLVHYPLFELVGRSGFSLYSKRNQFQTTFVVGPAMLVEMFTASMLVLHPELTNQLGLTWAGFILLLVIWLVTAVFSVPAHGVLEKGFDHGTHRRLVQTNWIRTACWSARGSLAILLLS